MMKKQVRKKAEGRITLKDVTAWRVLEEGMEEGGARAVVAECAGTALRPNVMLTDSGNVVVIQATIPALDASMGGTDAYLRSELRMSYGEEYWQKCQ